MQLISKEITRSKHMKHSLSTSTAFIRNHSSVVMQRLTTLAATTLVAATLTAPAKAQMPKTVYVWDGSMASASRVGSWGNGTAQPAANRDGSALQITTHNFSEGVRFDLNTPVNLDEYKQGGFWRIKVQMRAATPFGGAGGRRGRPEAGTGAPSLGVVPNSTTSTRFGAAMSPGQAFTQVQMQQRPQWGGAQRGGATGQRGRARQQAPTLTLLQLTAVLERGAMSGRVTITPAARGNAGAGQTLLLALRDMRPTPGAGGSVRRLILTGDRSATFGLEQIALVTETNSITASIRRESDAPSTQLREITVKPGRGTTLIADVEGGTSDLIVQWNFDADNSGAYPQPATAGARGGAARDRGPAAGGLMPGMGSVPGGAEPGVGIAASPRVDAVGLSAQPNWPNEEQNYRVEITVTDRSGRKAPVKASILVKTRA
jgi:hypothetical protein